MKDIINFYTSNCENLKQKISTLNKRIHLIGTIRLIIFLGTAISLYLLRDESWTTLVLLTIAFTIPFIVLMVVHNKYFYKRTYTETRLKLNEDELNAINYDFSAFDGAKEMIDGEHSFSLDLDLFGNKSFFQSLNRTVTAQGKKLLAEWFMNPADKKEDVLSRQEAITELSKRQDLFQHFYTLGKINKENNKSIEILDKIRQDFDQSIASPVWKILTWIVPAIWVILIGCNSFGLIQEKWIGIYSIVAIVVAYWNSKQVMQLYNSVDKMENILKTYSSLIEVIENEEFTSSELKKISEKLKNNNRKASESLKTLSRHIGALNQRFSLAGAILNILFMRDTRHSIALVKWKERHHNDIVGWIEALAEIDAYLSMGNYAFNHPDYIYPEVSDNYFVMEGKAMGHPLINRDVCVRNKIDIPKSPWFLIITGANMAGKSTSLRTVGINYLMACTGLPVCAEKMIFYPAHLVTSLRTSDSLASNESYFFAELKRLKMIIDRLQKGERLFIILDEILKGTNSADKQKGSMALMKQLVKLQSCGIIATHDLVLGSLEEEFPNEIKNYRFEADITDNELTFSYQLREGVAQNMNACFLMRKMGITV